MCLFKIINTRSRIQIMFHPKINLIKPATILPSMNLVTNPQTQEVTGIIARITLTIHDKPK